MALSIVSPFGSASAVFQPFILVHGVVWDGPLSHGMIFTPDFLTAANSNIAAFGRGCCVDPVVAQSTGLIYWEITWSGLLNTSLAGGIGFCNISAIGSYDALAANGTGGVIIRPDGSCWVNGTEDPAPFHTQEENDTVGFLLDMTNPVATFVNIFGVGGTCIGFQTSAFLLPPDNYIPCAVFDTASQFDILSVRANFDQNNQGSFLGPAVWPDALGNIICGWPNHP